MKKYSEQLKDPRWQRRRLQILQRDMWECVICRSKKETLHVHHLIYIDGRDPWEYADEDLTTLCEKCHKIASAYNLRPYHLRVMKRHFNDLPLLNCVGSLLDALLRVEYKTLIKLKTDEETDLIYLEEIVQDLEEYKKRR